jgi:hypothetical protein
MPDLNSPLPETAESIENVEAAKPSDEATEVKPPEAADVGKGSPQVNLDDLRRELDDTRTPRQRALDETPVPENTTLTPEQQKLAQRNEDIRLMTKEAADLGTIYGKDCQNFAQLDSLLGEAGANDENIEKLAIEMHIEDTDPAARKQKVQENLGRLHVEINDAAEEMAQAFVEALPEQLQADPQAVKEALRRNLSLTPEQLEEIVKDPALVKDIFKQRIPLEGLFDKVIERDERKATTTTTPDTPAASDKGEGVDLPEAQKPKSWKEKAKEWAGTTAYNELIVYGNENFSNALDMFFANHPSTASRRGGEFPENDETLAEQGKQVNEEIMDQLTLKGDKDKTNSLLKELIKVVSGIPLGDTVSKLVAELSASENPQEVLQKDFNKRDAFMALFNDRSGGAMITAMAKWITEGESGDVSIKTPDGKDWKVAYNQYIHQDGARVPYGITRQALDRFKTRISQA